MSRRTRILLIVALGLVAVLVAILLGVYFALRSEPAFYRQAMQTKSDALKKGSEQMLKQVGALQSVMNRSGRWQADITAEEINGWLAVDLRRNHPHLLPPTIYDPRAAIDASEITIACRYQGGGVNTVLSLAFRPYVPEPSVLALRIVRGRAGGLPLPLKGVLDGISKGATEMRFRLRWAQSGADPVALISLPSDDGDRVVRIESIELRKDAIHISGVTERRKP